MPSINIRLVTRPRVAVRAESSRPLPPREFVSLDIRGEMQRVFEIAVERSNSRCAPVSRLMLNWREESVSTPLNNDEVPVESQRAIPAKRSREV